jgi:protein TonB
VILLKRYLAISLALHLILGMSFWSLELQRQDEMKGAQSTDGVQWVDLRNRVTSADQDSSQTRRKNPPREKQLAHTELVKPSKEAPEDGRLGKQNQKVAHETQASRLGSFQVGRSGNKGGAEKGTSTEAENALSSLGLTGASMSYREPTSLEQQVREGASNQTSAWFDDVAIGERTLLNTREYVYYGFFLRVQEQFEDHWRDLVRKGLTQMQKSGKKLISRQSLETMVEVTLDEDGKLLDIAIKDSSGRYELDQAAVDAFREARQFPHPPKGLIEENGQVLLEWRFVLRT